MKENCVSITEMSPYGRAMFRDNFFHATALKLHRSTFYRLANLEKSAFHAVCRFHDTSESLSSMDEGWKEALNRIQEKLYSDHETLREMVATWESFARKGGDKLLFAVLKLARVREGRSGILGDVDEIASEIEYGIPQNKEKAARQLAKAAKSLVQHDHRLDSLIQELNLSRLEEATALFESGNVSIEFSRDRLSNDKLDSLDLLISEKKVMVTEMPAVYFATTDIDTENHRIKWDFSSKDSVIRTFLKHSKKKKEDIRHLIEKKDAKKHDVAKGLFSILRDSGEVKRWLGEKIYLYFEKPGQDFERHPGVPLSPRDFWALSMNLTLVYETREFLILEVTQTRSTILITWLNTSSHNKGNFFAYANPVL